MCRLCKFPYNLSTRLPLILSCCWHSFCLSCVNSKLTFREKKEEKTEDKNEQQQYHLRCTECNYEKHISSGINRSLRAQLELSLKYGSIVCVNHSDELVTRYNEKTKEFKCTRCVVNEDTGEEVKGEGVIEVD